VKGKPYLAVCAVYRDEAPNLAEWIEFHRLVGAERFFLYNNDSSDDHLAVLAPYLEEGLVVLEDWPGTARQHAAFYHCLETHRDDARWIAFIDLDEFLFCPEVRPVSEILRDFEDWPGVGVNLALYGTSGHLTRPDGLVIENYLYRGGGKGAKWIKSIVDPRRTLHCYNVHFFAYESGHAVDVCKRPIEEWHTESFLLSPLRINHYYMKSQEEVKRKFATPRADTAELRPPLNWDKLPRVEARYVRDEAILQYLPRLKAALR
jgi:hypothetical protein